MKHNYSGLGCVVFLLACLLAGCASKPVREFEENTKRVVSEQPVTPP
jgi:hypothetical protein